MRLRSVAVVLFTVISSIVTLPASVGVAKSPAASVPPSTELVANQVNSMPLPFTKNEGQWDERVLFRTSAGGATVWFCRDGIYYQFAHRILLEDVNVSTERGLPLTLGKAGLRRPSDHETDSVETVVVKAAFIGANPGVAIVGDGLLEYRCNYFFGNEPEEWRTNVPNYAEIVYRDVYPGIDAHFAGGNGQLQTRWVAKAGADLSQVRFDYDGNADVAVTAIGEVAITAPWGTLMQSALLPGSGESSQTRQGYAETTRGLTAEAAGHTAAGLTLVYSTFLGGNGYPDRGRGIAVDGGGSSYVTGSAGSWNFPTMNPIQDTSAGGNYDVFVTKLGVSGTALIYSTYLGGSGSEEGRGIVVDGSGSAYLTGVTSSADFPLMSPMQATQVGGINDGFVTKLDATGAVLVYSTYLGGTDADYAHGIAVDVSGSAYVTGETSSTDFPLMNPLQALIKGETDAFVTKLSASGTALSYSTYLGGSLYDGGGWSGYDGGSSIAVDSGGSAYVTGYTWSRDFPVINPFQGAHAANGDVFVTKLSASGMALVYSTYLGGSGGDEGRGIAIDGGGSAYVTGRTGSSDFPLINPLQGTHHGFFDVFVTKLSESGTGLVYSTYFGGGDMDDPAGIAVDESGRAYVTGYTDSQNLPLTKPIQGWPGNFPNNNGFVAALNGSGTTMVYSTYLGGSNADFAEGIAVDGSGNAYVTGQTWSADFPLMTPMQGALGGTDAFVTKLGFVCACDCHTLPADCLGAQDVLDVAEAINRAFRLAQPIPDPNGNCPWQRTDTDCDGFTTVLDVVRMINVAFRGANAATEFCNPCP